MNSAPQVCKVIPYKVSMPLSKHSVDEIVDEIKKQYTQI